MFKRLSNIEQASFFQDQVRTAEIDKEPEVCYNTLEHLYIHAERNMSYHLTKDKSKQSYICLTVGKTEKELGFTWFFGEGGKGELRYAKKSEFNDTEMPRSAKCIATEGVSANDRGQYSFQLTVGELERNTEYVYQLTNGDTVSDIYSFKTGGEEEFSFALVGDPQVDSHREDDNVDNWARALKVIANDERFADADFILSTGDQIEEYNDEDDYSAFIEHDEMRRFPLATAIGNHETDSPLYHLHFNVCNFSKFARTEAGTNNYFIYNGVLFIILNTNVYNIEEHRDFINEVLAANPKVKWRIALFHTSIFTAGKHGPQENLIAFRKKLAPVLTEARFDLVLMGHDHIYCRTYIMDGITPLASPALYEGERYSTVTDPKGTVYITVNSASASKTYDITGDYGYTAFANQEHISNISRVSISDKRLNVTTYRTHDMSVVDNFTIRKSR